MKLDCKHLSVTSVHLTMCPHPWRSQLSLQHRLTDYPASFALRIQAGKPPHCLIVPSRSEDWVDKHRKAPFPCAAAIFTRFVCTHPVVALPLNFCSRACGLTGTSSSACCVPFAVCVHLILGTSPAPPTRRLSTYCPAALASAVCANRTVDTIFLVNEPFHVLRMTSALHLSRVSF
jgi:hypothetical protein